MLAAVPSQPFIVLQALDAQLVMSPTAVAISSPAPENHPEIVSAAPLKKPVIADQILPKKSLTPLHEVSTPSFAPPKIPEKKSITGWNTALMASQMPWKKPATVFHTPFMVSHVEVKNPVIPDQILEKKLETEVHTVSQSVPNHPRNTSARPFSASSTDEKIPLMPSHIPEKISFTPDHA